MAEITTNRRIVKGAFVTYRTVVTKWDGSQQEVSRSADRGDEIELTEREEARLDHLGMLMPPGTPKTSLARLEQQLQEEAKRERQIAGLDPEVRAQLDAARAAEGLPPEAVLPDITVDFDAAGKTDDDLAAWIAEASPTVDEVVAAAGEDADLADRLLAAEKVAKSGKPRKGVEDGLRAVIDAAGKTDDD